MARIVAERRVVGMLRPTECGHWYLTTDGERLGGALLIDPALTGRTGERFSGGERVRGLDALVDEVRAIRSAALPGVLPVADLVIIRDNGPHSGHVWLLTDAPPGPTVRDLLELGPSHGLDAGSAATLLNETAQTILSLHRSGVVHGGLGPSTVFVAADGKAALGEVGLAAALGLRAASPTDDVQAWAQLATLLAREWVEDVDGSDMLTRAAATAAHADLVRARDELLAGRDLLPPDFLERRALIAAVAQWTSAVREHLERGSQTADVDPRIDLSHGVSLLGGHVSTAWQTASDARPAARAAGVSEAEPVWSGRDGGGPPARWFHDEPKAGRQESPAWPARSFDGSLRQPAPAVVEGLRRPAPPRGNGRVNARGRRRTLLLAIVAVLLAAAVGGGWLWWRSGGDDLAVERVSVQAPADALACDSTAEIVGVIETNGEGGDVRYQWIRESGGQGDATSSPTEPEVLTVQVPDGQTRTEVYLRWTFKGEGTVEAAAHLDVLEPTSATARADLSYVCE